MFKGKMLSNTLAVFISSILSIVMIISANTSSCFMVYQPKAPKALERYSKIR